MRNNKDYMRKYMANRYEKRRVISVQLLGGKCSSCGSTENLEFDHIDRFSKAHEISDLLLKNFDTLVKELKKCQLLCKKCHTIKTIKDLGKSVAKGTHGTLSSGRYCKCHLCRKAKSDYMKEYSKSRKKKSHP